MSEKKRRKWTAGEKLRIVLTCLQPGAEVSEVCRREGINPTMYYTWKKRLLASAGQIFEEKPKKRDQERERAEREMSRMKEAQAVQSQRAMTPPWPKSSAARTRRTAARTSSGACGGESRWGSIRPENTSGELGVVAILLDGLAVVERIGKDQVHRVVRDTAALFSARPGGSTGRPNECH